MSMEADYSFYLLLKYYYDEITELLHQLNQDNLDSLVFMGGAGTDKVYKNSTSFGILIRTMLHITLSIHVATTS